MEQKENIASDAEVIAELEEQAKEKGLLPFNEWKNIFEREFYEGGSEFADEDDPDHDMFYEESELLGFYKEYVGTNNDPTSQGAIRT